MDHLTPHPELFGLPFTVESYHDMPYRQLGQSGLRVPAIGLGTWKVGYPELDDGARVGEKDAFRLFDHAIEQGVTLWDTANRYNASSGNSERIIGKWLKSNPSSRRDVVLATKIFGLMDGQTPNHCGLSRLNILESVKACLARLQTSYIDLLYFHSWDPLTPIEESLSAVEDLVRQGLVRYFAVSNFTVEQIKAYRAVEQRSGSIRGRIVAVQNQFDILHGESQKQAGVLEQCAETGISFIAWSPLARGLLTQRYLDPEKVQPGDRLYDENTLSDDINRPTRQILRRLAALAESWEMTLSQLSLAYLLSLPGMGPAIPSSSTVAQLESNAQAGRISFSLEQKQKIAALIKEYVEDV